MTGARSLADSYEAESRSIGVRVMKRIGLIDTKRKISLGARLQVEPASKAMRRGALFGLVLALLLLPVLAGPVAAQAPAELVEDINTGNSSSQINCAPTQVRPLVFLCRESCNQGTGRVPRLRVASI